MSWAGLGRLLEEEPLLFTASRASTSFSAVMHCWQRQDFPVKVTRSPVGKGFLHRAHVKQAWWNVLPSALITFKKWFPTFVSKINFFTSPSTNWLHLAQRVPKLVW